MTAIEWDLDRRYEHGVSRAVVYLPDAPPVAWNGLVSVEEDAPAAFETMYFDGDVYVTPQPRSEFSATIAAYTYPENLSDYVDSLGYTLDLQRKPPFNLTYRTEDGDSYRIHLVYNATLVPNSLSMATMAQELAPAVFGWGLVTKPKTIPGARQASHLYIRAADASPEAIAALSDILYGTATTDPRFPSPTDVLGIFESNPRLRIIDHGDGSWTAIGPDEWITMTSPTSFEITSPSAVWIDGDTYTISNW
jgi:hypothetical protein